LKTCSKCGQDHPRCQAHRQRTDPPVPCMKYPIAGGRVCSKHGGNTRAAREKAAERVFEQNERAQAVEPLARFQPKREIHPATALIDLVQYQAGVVEYWRGRVEQINEEDLTYGMAEQTDSEGPFGPSSQQKFVTAANIVYKLLREAQRDLADYASMALKAGVQERQIRLAEEQGSAFARAQRAILASMWEVVVRAKLTDSARAELEDAWNQAIGIVVPRELLALSSGS
jgi:hypothetical protein